MEYKPANQTYNEEAHYKLGKIATAILTGLAGLVLLNGCAPEKEQWSWAKNSFPNKAKKIIEITNTAKIAATKNVFK